MPFKDEGHTHKTCPQCKTRRAIECFNRSGKGMRRSQCQECEAAGRPKDRDSNGVSSSTRHNIRRRYKILQHYSGKAKPECECCGEQTYEFLSLDHIDGDGSKHRREIGRSTVDAWVWKNNFPPGFRVLCHNCNQAIGAYGFCPHQHPEKARKGPPPLLTEKKQQNADTSFLETAARLHSRGLALTASALADATGVSLTSAEKRLARLRKEQRWPYKRVKANQGKF